MSDTTADLPSVQVYYKLAHPKNEPLKPTIDLLHGKLTAEDTKIGAVCLQTNSMMQEIDADTWFRTNSAKGKLQTRFKVKNEPGKILLLSRAQLEPLGTTIHCRSNLSIDSSYQCMQVWLTSSRDAAYLTDLQWAEVLRNCGAMYGWIVDREKNKIIRAPKPGKIMNAHQSN